MGRVGLCEARQGCVRQAGLVAEGVLVYVMARSDMACFGRQGGSGPGELRIGKSRRGRYANNKKEDGYGLQMEHQFIRKR